MSLVIAMKAVDGIVMAADTRGTIGDPRGLTAINDNYQKIFSLGHCGIGFAGTAEMGNTLLDELHKKGLDNFKDIDSALGAIHPEVTNCFNVWFQSIPPANRTPVLIILAGYRYSNGQEPEALQYVLGSQNNFAPQLSGDRCMIGVPQYAVYLFHRYYDEAITLDRAKALAEYLIAETASQDPKVGGPIRIAEVKPGMPYRELDEDEVAKVHHDNEELNKGLRQFFLTGGQQNEN